VKNPEVYTGYGVIVKRYRAGDGVEGFLKKLDLE